jgi:DNA-binding NarL/FixJ family response regulator
MCVTVLNVPTAASGSSMKKTRIFIADDHDIVRRGICPLVNSEPDLEVCGEAADGRAAITAILKLKPDVVVLDVNMPSLGGVEATRQIKRDLPETHVLIFTGQESEALVHQLFSAGARGFVLKNEGADHLIPAIRALTRGEPFFGVRISRIVFDQYVRNSNQPELVSPDGLSPREREIVQLLAEGKSNKEVAGVLGTSVKTVETQRGAIMKKLGFQAFSELVRYAVRNHIVSE